MSSEPLAGPDDLIRLGVVRSRRLVADIAEALAARYYGVTLASNANTPGYDLQTTDGRRVQVRTLRSEPHRERTLMGAMKEPYDVLLAIKLSIDYEPLRAIEVPRRVSGAPLSPRRANVLDQAARE